MRTVRRGDETGNMDTMTLGDVEITRVIEMSTLRMDRESMYPDCDPSLWQSHEDWLVPDYYDPESDDVLVTIQSWLVRSGGRTILVDTGTGDDKERPQQAAFHHKRSDYLGALQRAGARPEDIDTVVCTHLHSDHVGWNTRLVDGEWVPTFPNATYVLPQADFEYFKPGNLPTNRRGAGMTNIYEDSVQPVADAGQVQTWEEHHDLTADLRLEPAAGHTPGSSVVTLNSGPDRAVFVGDLVHSPLQVPEPQCSPGLDEFPDQARKARREVLGWAADENVLVVPAHFHKAGAFEIDRAGESFNIKEWKLPR